MVRVWGELDQLERDNRLSFLREPDLGFAWTAYRWAKGHALQDVLDDSPDVAAGDFVRWTKQVIDLLDQIAAAADEKVAAVARSAAASMRRGVIAYTSVG
jgi:ATP-dependent RNA helicase HelY